jgi:hypothetical protein
MAVLLITPVNDRINTGMDGRTNKWLKEKLSEKGIVLSDSQISQRRNGLIEWSGNEAIACFEILNMEIKESA